jgi:glycosyltransferase involved in cell wall biosynthesis
MASPAIEEGLRDARRILIVADPNSPLTRERSLVGQAGGFAIHWYSDPRADIDGLASAIAPPVIRLPKLGGLLRMRHLELTIKRVRPHLIHVHWAQQDWNNLVLARFRPLIVTVMGADILPDQSFRGRKTRWLTKKLLDQADVITSKSAFMDAALGEIGNYAHKIRRITWGVDSHRFRPGLDVGRLRDRWGVEPLDFVVFSPRGCQPFYNHHRIIRAFAAFVQRSGSRAKLLIAEFSADPAYCQRLRGLVQELGIWECVRFVGDVSHEEMPYYFNLAQIVVSMAPSDGMPHSLYEAMACGSYPILNDLPQYYELVRDGANGRLVPAGDVKRLAMAIAWAEKNPFHRQQAAGVNRQRILDVANKDEQDQLVNSIYYELVERYTQ